MFFRGPNSCCAAGIPRGWLPGSVRLDNAQVLADAVTVIQPPLGIGLFSAIGNSTPLVVGGTCGLAIPATRDTIRSEDYPLDAADCSCSA